MGVNVVFQTLYSFGGSTNAGLNNVDHVSSSDRCGQENGNLMVSQGQPITDHGQMVRPSQG